MPKPKKIVYKVKVGDEDIVLNPKNSVEYWREILEKVVKSSAKGIKTKGSPYFEQQRYNEEK